MVILVILIKGKYNEKGNKIEENHHYYYDLSFNNKSTYTYDEKGNMIEDNFYEDDEGMELKKTYKYEFDTMGNCIKKTTITDGKPTELSERVIKYY